jgi:hypothetical protein
MNKRLVLKSQGVLEVETSVIPETPNNGLILKVFF